jgi:hypothetical protein
MPSGSLAAQVRAGPEMTVPKPTIVPKSATISSSDAIVRGMCKPSNMRKAGCSRSLMYCSPVLRHSAGLIQAANFRSAVVF